MGRHCTTQYRAALPLIGGDFHKDKFSDLKHRRLTQQAEKQSKLEPHFNAYATEPRFDFSLFLVWLTTN